MSSAAPDNVDTAVTHAEIAASRVTGHFEDYRPDMVPAARRDRANGTEKEADPHQRAGHLHPTHILLPRDPTQQEIQA